MRSMEESVVYRREINYPCVVLSLRTRGDDDFLGIDQA